MTLKQKRLLQAIPNSNSLSEAAKKAGYSDYTSTSSIYGLVRNSKSLRNYFDVEYIRKEIRKAQKEASKGKDRTNNLRALELMSRIEGLQLERTEVTNKNPEKTIIVYATKPANVT